MTIRTKHSSKTRYTRASIIGVLAMVMLALVCFGFPVSSAHAASTGRIFGQLLNGTHKNAPIAGQSVTLQMAQGNTAKDLLSVTTDTHGSYVFPNLTTDKPISYALYIRYTILLHKPDAQKGSIAVSELYIFRNLDTHTYVGSLDASHGKPNALRFSLPHTATNVSLGTGFDGYKAIEVNSGVASDAAIPPGDSQFAFTFDMPYYTNSSYDFDYKVVYPTVELTLLLPPEIHGSSSILVAKGPVTSQQSTFNLFQASALQADQETHVQLDGLPVINPVSSPATSTPDAGNPWLVIGILLAMAIILLVTGLIYRSLRRSVPAKKKRSAQKQPVQAPASSQRSSKVAGAATKPDADKEQALLQELLDLDKAFEAGKMSKSVYQERRAKTKARFRALLSEKVTS